MSELWQLNGHDNRAHFLDEEEMSPDDFCPECGLLVNRAYRPKRLVGFRAFGRDVTSTYDNRLIFSRRLVEFCRDLIPGQMDFAQLGGGAEPIYLPTPIAMATMSKTLPRRCGDLCELCCEFEYEMISQLRVESRTLDSGFSVFHSDREYGNRLERQPLLLFRDEAKRAIESAKFKGLEWEPIELS